MNEEDFSQILPGLDFGPLSVEVNRETSSPEGYACVTLRWDSRSETFVAEFKRARTLREIRNAIWKARSYGDKTRTPPLVVVPYLNDEALRLLQKEQVCGLDLSGNGYVEIPGRWWFLQRGFPNKYPKKHRSREPYRGKSALVGRTLLVCPKFSGVSNVQEEIERRGSRLSLSQVSKVLKAMEEDLTITRTPEEIRLAQPAKLLDALVSGYTRLIPLMTVQARATLSPGFFANLLDRADALGIRISGFDPQRYAVAPTARERLDVYVEPPPEMDLPEVMGIAPAHHRFANVAFHVVDDESAYFDLQHADGFRWSPPLQVYLELMQGGKREKEIAGQLKNDLLESASRKAGL